MSTFVSFGRFFKNLRIKRGLTLRSFCQEHGLDPGNVSKLERGLIPPPKSREVLEKYAVYLNLEIGTDEWYEFFDLAAACYGQIPPDVMDNPELAAKLPLIFRTLRGQEVPEEQLKDLAELIRRS
jgi:transcriptional regulator with XRE-family HTH domain